MKKRFILFGLAIVLAFGSVIAQAGLGDDSIDPTCSYDKCPGGWSMCCTQGGVTLYNKA